MIKINLSFSLQLLYNWKQKIGMDTQSIYQQPVNALTNGSINFASKSTSAITCRFWSFPQEIYKVWLFR